MSLYSSLLSSDHKDSETFKQNSGIQNHVINNSDHFAVVKIESYINITFSNRTFLDNTAAAIDTFLTNVMMFRGNNTFPNNSGGSGAELALFINSYMYLKPSVCEQPSTDSWRSNTQILHWS